MQSGLQNLQGQRLHEAIVQRFHALIQQGTLEHGAKLPAERVLAEQLKVSRSSVREAIRTLEQFGALKAQVARDVALVMRQIAVSVEALDAEARKDGVLRIRREAITTPAQLRALKAQVTQDVAGMQAARKADAARRAAESQPSAIRGVLSSI